MNITYNRPPPAPTPVPEKKCVVQESDYIKLVGLSAGSLPEALDDPTDAAYEAYATALITVLLTYRQSASILIKGLTARAECN